MDEVIEGLWVGDIEDAREGDTSQFDRVVTVCQDDVGDNIGCTYSHYNMSDGPANSYGGDSSYELFEQAADEVAIALADGESVFVHCHMGQSRSVSVCIAAVASYEGLRYEDARRVVFEARPPSRPCQRLREHAQQYADTAMGMERKPPFSKR